MEKNNLLDIELDKWATPEQIELVNDIKKTDAYFKSLYNKMCIAQRRAEVAPNVSKQKKFLLQAENIKSTIFDYINKQVQLRSLDKRDSLSLKDIKKSLSKKDYTKLNHNFYAIHFMLDFTQDLLLESNELLKKCDDRFSISAFDTLKKPFDELSKFMHNTHMNESEELQVLFAEMADEINEYLAGKMKAFEKIINKLDDDKS